MTAAEAQRMAARAAGVLCLLLLISLVCGCGGSEGQVLRRWALHEGARVTPVELPAHLDRELPKKVGSYRLATRVMLNGDLRSHDVDLVIPSFAGQVTLFVAGKKMLDVTRSGEHSGRHVGPHRWEIPHALTESGALSLELEIAHTWTQSAWWDVPPRLVPAAAITPVVERNRLLNDRGGWFGLVGLSQMGLTFLAVFLWDTRRRSYLWFAIQALSASYYPAYVLGLTTWLGQFFETLLLAQSLAIAPIISVYYTSELFGRGRPSRLWLGLLALALLVPLPQVFSPYIDSTYGSYGVVACVAAGIVYQIATGMRLISTHADRGIVSFFLCCWFALGSSAWIDLWAWIGGGEVLAGARPACVGLGLFGIFQSMLLSRSHFRSLEEADRLNTALRVRLADLEERQGEIQVLNEELRQQVARRSAHILATIIQSERPSGPVRLEPGAIVENRYRVLDVLGSGGMGTVYKVERLHDERKLALKVTREVRGLALARLAREAQLATRVRHLNVVSVVDADVSTGGYVYLVMELVEGCSLADCDTPRELAWSLRVLLQTLDGVRALHALGIVHRDLKPANVLLCGDIEREPQVKVTDFGISRGPASIDDTANATPSGEASSSSSVTVRFSPRPADPLDRELATDSEGSRSVSGSTPQLTRTGAIAGTPLYMAPELARHGAEITPAVDVFSFGVVAYRLLSGAPPYAEAPFLACLDGREAPQHAPLSVPGLPAEAARVIDACLSSSPSERPDTSEIAEALSAVLESCAPLRQSC